MSGKTENADGKGRGGSVRHNRFWAFLKWILTLIYAATGTGNNKLK